MAAAGRTTRFWDASCFLTLLNDETGADDCEYVLNQARRSRTVIYVSPIVQIEVVRPKGSSAPVPMEAREQIRAFFENDFIKWRMIDRKIANDAQKLCWDYGVHPRDASHLAVAMDLQCDLLETYDRDLLKWNGRIPTGAPGIQRPRRTGQLEFM